ncbi:MAG: RIP metalloprotease RseP [Myxococcales bacterium]|nr:RIP metalloprotease RseP [Myxococcales bacterium]
MDLVYFALFVSVLIFVHELGHFTWAKIFGVKVLMFSIGFGPKIIRIRGHETEYCIGILPLGGFVKMLEERTREPVLPEDKHRTFEAQALWKRFIIVLAGPAMNLLFPVLLYVTVFASGTGHAPATIGTVLPGRAADGKLLPGDRVLAIDGTRITTFIELERSVRKNPEKELKFSVFRDNRDLEVSITPDARMEERVFGSVDRIGFIGVGPHRHAAVLGIRAPESPAFRAGLRTFDVVTEIRGAPVRSYADLERLLAENRGETVPVTYLRPRPVVAALGALGDLYVYESGLAALTPDPTGATITERTGIELGELYLADIDSGSPEYAAGMRPGDRIESIDSVAVTSWSTYEEALMALPRRQHTVEFARGGERFLITVELATKTLVSDAKNPGLEERAATSAVLGGRNWAPRVPEKSVGRPSLLYYALPSALDETITVIRFITRGFAAILEGELSLSTIGGPITVFDVVIEERQRGANYLLWAMAVISINLGLINLFPIPVLDGGHLFFFAVEALMRRPVPLRVREVASLFGLITLVLLMVLALKNDVERRWDVIAAQVNELVG